MRKLFEYIGLISLIFFSFFITEKTYMLAKDVDEIMLNIREKSTVFNTSPRNAKITDEYITPGMCGKQVNIDKSYTEMKKLGFYDEKKYQYDSLIPDISLEKNYDKYIISGNNYEKKIYVFLELNDSNKYILEQYEFSGYNFIVNSNFYINNSSLISKLIVKNNSILLSEVNEKQYKLVSKDYYINTNNRIYCYNNKNDNFLKVCVSGKSNTISKIEQINSKYFITIKNNIENGKFFNISLSNNLIQEIELIENYFDSKGFTKATIDNSLKECG